MATLKYIARNAPYIEETFGSWMDAVYGSSRMLSGGAVTVTSTTTIQIAPYAFIQSGLVVVNQDGHLSVPIPTFSSEKRPIYLIVSSPDITLASGVVLTATPALYAATGVVLAVRTNDVWVLSPAASVTASDDAIRLVEQGLGTGVLSGLDPRLLISGTDSVTGIGVRVGRGLNSQGVQTLGSGLAAGAAADEHVELPNGVQDGYWPKTNYYLLRQPAGVIRAGGPSLSVLPGDTPGRTGATVDAGAGVIASAVVSRQSDGLTGVVWTKGSTLNYATFSNTSDTPVLAPLTIFTSGGTFDGNRDIAAAIRSDGALIITFSDSVSAQRVLKVLSINFDTGIAVGGDGGVQVIGALANQVRAPRMVIDVTDTMHAVAQHNEASPNNQVYYFRVNVAAGASFGALLSSTPRIVNGTNDGGNDTNPSIAVDSFRNLTVAYSKGTGSNIYGDIVLVSLDSGGNTLSATVISTSAITAAGGIATGYDTPVTLSRSAYPRAIVTPQGNLYVLFAASSGANLQNLFLYAPSFLTQFGANCIDLFRTNAADYQWLEFIADELGVLRSLGAITTAGAGIQYLRLDTSIAPQNVLLPSVLDGFTSVITGNRFAVSLTPGGSNKLGVYDSSAGNLVTATIAGGTSGVFTPHPSDSFLGAWSLPAIATTPSVSSTRPQRMRPARYSNPVQVGRDGDFIGFDSLNSAIDVARGSGLTIRLMPGLHELYPAPAFIYGGVELDGCPGAIVAVNSTNSNEITFAGRGSTTATANPATGVFDVSGSTSIFPGDVLSFPPGGTPGALDPVNCHIVEVESATRVRVFPDVSISTPAGVLILASPVRFRGIRFIGVGSTANIQFATLWNPRIEDCDFENIQLQFINIQSGTFRRNRMNGQNVVFVLANRMAVIDNEALGFQTADKGAIEFSQCSRMIVTGNRSMDHGAGVFGYQVAASSDFYTWGSNLGTVISDDSGRLVSNNQVITATEIFAKDIRVERLNGGSYDMRLAAIAAEIDSLKQGQPPMVANWFKQFNFDTNAQFFWT